MDSIDKLRNEREIIRVVNTLFVETDNLNWEAVGNCFDDNVIFDMTSMVGGEPQQLKPRDITEMWNEGLKDLDAVFHLVGNQEVNIDKEDMNKAMVFCYANASHYLASAQGQKTRSFAGSYNLELSKKSGAWKVTKFKFNLKFIGGNAELK